MATQTYGAGTEITNGAIPLTKDNSPLTLPVPKFGEDITRIVVAIFDTDWNTIAFKCEGDYIVDWGDGTVEEVATTVVAEHKYTYSNASLASFEDYKIATITITPQTGQHITSIDLDKLHSDNSLIVGATQILSIYINAPLLETLVLTSINIKHSMLRRFVLGENIVTDLSGLLSSSGSLIYVDIDSNSATTMASIFEGCVSLVTIPSFDTTNLINFTDVVPVNGSIQRILVPIPSTADISNNKLSSVALNEIFTLLPTVTDETLTIAGNFGEPTCDTTIATAKNWTIVGTVE